jgi:hypothetical protein
VDERTSTPRDPAPQQRRDGDAARRDQVGHDRDERAALRDTAAATRDVAAKERDRVASARDSAAGRRSREILGRLVDLQRQIDDRLRRHADAVADLPTEELSPSVLTALRAYAAEQRRLADLERQALHALIDEMGAELGHARADRHAAGHNRHDAAEDRAAAADDRVAASADRDTAQADRDQAAIERVQADPTTHHAPAVDRGDRVARVARVMEESRQRILSSRAALDRHGRPSEPGTTATPDEWDTTAP